MKKIIILAIIAGVGIFGYQQYKIYKENKAKAAIEEAQKRQEAEAAQKALEAASVEPTQTTAEQRLQLIEFAIANDLNNIKKTIDANNLNPNFLLSTSEIENYPLFRSKIKNANMLELLRPNTDDYSLAYFAIVNQNKDLLEYLASKKADFNIKTPDNGSLLEFALEKGSGSELIKTLLDKGVKLDMSDAKKNPAVFALKKGDLELLGIIFDAAEKNGQNINSVLPSFENALSSKNDGLAGFIIQRTKMDVNAQLPNGLMPAHAAAYNLRDKFLANLVKQGALLDAKDKYGRTPLFYAIGKQGNSQTVKFLIENAVDSNATDAKGLTLLMLSISKKDDESTKLLLEYGANANVAGADGVTPLMLAVQAGNYDLAKTLLASKANVNARTKNGSTALMYAASKGRGSTAKLLLQNGANKNYKNKDGSTAADLAIQRGYMSTYDLIEGYK